MRGINSEVEESNARLKHGCRIRLSLWLKAVCTHADLLAQRLLPRYLLSLYGNIRFAANPDACFTIASRSACGKIISARQGASPCQIES
jgi:hypothetical protein